MSQAIWSISSLVRYIKSSLDHDMNLQSILIKGEVSNFTHHRSGHYYFTLKDNSSRISCVMFASYARRCPLQIKDGMKVLVSANVSMYEPQGNCQLYVLQVQLDGIGDLFMQLEEIKRRLNAEGLFDEAHKKMLPEYPMNIGVISARTGAATQDVFTTIKRRWPLASVFFYPCLVQGKDADVDLIKTLTYADANHHDCILIVRGGGSIEDLWCFNSEALARCVYHCQSVIVSGVGHETDTTLIDYVSDRRAPTPTAAAELITPDWHDVVNKVTIHRQRLLRSIQNQLTLANQALNQMKSNKLLSEPLNYIQNDAMRLAMDVNRLEKVVTMGERLRYKLNQLYEAMSSNGRQLCLENRHDLMQINERLMRSIEPIKVKKQQELKRSAALLDAFSPLKIVARGYSLTYDEKQHLVQSINDVSQNEQLKIRVSDGMILTRVEGKELINE